MVSVLKSVWMTEIYKVSYVIWLGSILYKMSKALGYCLGE